MADYRDIGCRYWLRANRDKYDPVGVELVRGHYSRRKPDSPQFMPESRLLFQVRRLEAHRLRKEGSQTAPGQAVRAGRGTGESSMIIQLVLCDVCERPMRGTYETLQVGGRVFQVGACCERRAFSVPDPPGSSRKLAALAAVHAQLERVGRAETEQPEEPGR